MPVSFERIRLGEQYARKALAELWGYKGWQAIGRGVVTPANDTKILLFVTRHKQKSLRQYEDRFEGNYLHWEGPDDHFAEDRMLKTAKSGEEIHLFYRERHHLPFTYFGGLIVKDAQVSKSAAAASKFLFLTQRFEAISASSLATERAAQGSDESFVPDEEGRRRLRVHVTYERSRKNRARAIELHGTVCWTCGFDFNAFYGEDLARDYIEIHHVASITAGARMIDPSTDLIPLCANCHKMVHRKPGEIMDFKVLKKRLSSSRSTDVPGGLQPQGTEEREG